MKLTYKFQAINANQAVIIVGDPDSWCNCTKVLKYLIELGKIDYGQIGFIEEHRSNVVSFSKLVAKRFRSRLGEKIGYKIQFEDCSSDKTVIK